ncbi:MAG: PKD domain-containing protein [Nannocystales bacterium]
MRRSTIAALLLLGGCGDDSVSAGTEEGGSTSEASTTTGTSGSSSGSSAGPPSSSGSTTTGAVDSSSTGEPQPLVSIPGEDRYALVGDTVLLDGVASTGAVLYQWTLDDGSRPDEPSEDPTLEISWDEPGRYRPVLTVFDAEGNSRSEDVTITVTFEPSHAPEQSSTIDIDDGDRGVVVSPDSDELITVERSGDSFALGVRTTTCAGPRTVAWWGEQAVVSCPRVDRVAVHALDSGTFSSVDLPWGSRPFGVVVVGDTAFVSLQGSGAVARISLDGTPTLLEVLPAIEDARGIAVLPDGRLGVTRWRSPDTEARMVVLDPVSGERDDVALQFDPQVASDTEAGGVPSYLAQLLISPIGDFAAVPSLQANINHGDFVNGEPFSFETTLRGVVSYFDVAGDLSEDFTRRRHFDNRGLLSAGVFSSRGDFLFLASRGSRAVERVDTFTGAQAGAILEVGFAPEGLALTGDDRYLYVEAFMSREVVVYDVTSFAQIPEPIATIPITDGEPLDAEVALGKILFNDSFDVRLSRDGYLACAHCHLDGESDRRTWDFTDRGEGLRNTISLLGHGGDAHGPMHWSANFDEVHDFENDIRGPQSGMGLMSDADFESGTRSHPLGDPKAGVSASLDALAAYVTTLDTFPRSPYRNADGSLSPDAEAGRLIFESAPAGCTSCHAGPRLTDSVFIGPGVPLLHNVGTITEASGQRLGGPLTGIDTPTLHGLWNNGPFLHDGSAGTVLEVIGSAGDTHGSTAGLSEIERGQLAVYLLSLDGSAG